MESSNQLPQVHEVQSQTPPRVSKSNNTKLLILVLAGVAIVLAIGAYALGSKQTQPVVQNTISPTPIDETANPDSIGANWKKYTHTIFPVSFQYPSTWTMEPLQYEVDIPTVRLRKMSTVKDPYPTEILVGDWAVYSTSGALCANQGCDLNFGKLETNLSGEKITTNIIKAFDEKSQRVGYYAAQITLPKIFAIKIPPLYPQPIAPTVTVRFQTDQEKQEILQILSTFRFTP